MSEHELKIWPSYFEDVKAGRKRFEVRRADRDYRLDDVLRLREFDPDPDRKYRESDWTGYTSREVRAKVTYLMRLGDFVTDRPLVILGFEILMSEEPAT